jgi:hypothetical protein
MPICRAASELGNPNYPAECFFPAPFDGDDFARLSHAMQTANASATL